MKLKVVVVGCGKIADGHVEEIRKLSNAELVAVCDLEPLMAEQLGVRFGIPAQYSDFDRMLSEQRPDVVHITTPPQSHLLLAKKAISVGAHVYIEKPIACNYKDTVELVDITRKAGRKLTVNYWPNFDPPGLALRELVANGILGEVVHVESYLGYNLAGAFGQALLSDTEHWVHKLPGKLFQNNLDHVLNKIVPFLSGEQPEVHAMAYRRRANLKNDTTDAMFDELRVMMRGSRVSGYATFCSHSRPAEHFVRIYGTANTVHVDFNNRTLVLDQEQTLPSAIGRLLPAWKQGISYMKEARHNAGDFLKSRAHYFAGMNGLISQFYNCICTDGEVPIPYSEMLSVAWITDQIVEQTYPVGVK